jgi:hypothetical protein
VSSQAFFYRVILFLCCCFNYWLPSNTWAAETNADVGTFTRNNQINQTQLQRQLNSDQTHRKKNQSFTPLLQNPSIHPHPFIVPAIKTETAVFIASIWVARPLALTTY